MTTDTGPEQALAAAAGWEFPSDATLTLARLEAAGYRLVPVAEIERLRTALEQVATAYHEDGDHGIFGGPPTFRDCSNPDCSKAAAALTVQHTEEEGYAGITNHPTPGDNEAQADTGELARLRTALTLATELVNGTRAENSRLQLVNKALREAHGENGSVG